MNLSGFPRIYPYLRMEDQCRPKSFQKMARGSGDFMGKNIVSPIKSRITYANSGFSKRETVPAEVCVLPAVNCTLPTKSCAEYSESRTIYDEGKRFPSETGTASAEACMLFEKGCTLPAVTRTIPAKTGTVYNRPGALSVEPEKIVAEGDASSPITGAISAV